MAIYAGVKSVKTYQNWEKGVSEPSMNQFLAMCINCGFNVEQIYELISDATTYLPDQHKTD